MDRALDTPDSCERSSLLRECAPWTAAIRERTLETARTTLNGSRQLPCDAKTRGQFRLRWRSAWLRCGRLTFDMRGGRQLAKPDVARPLDGRVSPQLVACTAEKGRLAHGSHWVLSA